MSQRYYLPDHDSQRGTGPLATTNCAAASGAMLVDQGTLGRKKPAVAAFRRETGDLVGGLQMNAVAAAAEEYGIEVRLYDYDDQLKWWRLLRYLDKGWFAVVAGDYDLIRGELRGAEFDGFHAVMYQQHFTHNLRVGDPLQDDWVRWPNDLAYRYVRKFDRQTSGGIHAVVLKPKYARTRSEVKAAEIRPDPGTSQPPIGVLRQGQRLVCGGTVRGSELLGVDRWRKVWVPGVGTFGYVHWSVTWQS